MPIADAGLDLELEMTNQVSAKREVIDEMLKSVEGDDEFGQTMEFKTEDLDFDIESTHGASTALSAEIDKELADVDGTVQVNMDDAIDFDMGDLGLTNNTTKAADIVADQSEETMDFAFDLDNSLDVDIGEDDLSEDVPAVNAADGLNADIRNLVESEDSVSDTAELEVEESFDLLLNESNTGDDDSLDFNFEDALGGVDADPFPDATLPGMVDEAKVDTSSFDTVINNPDDEHSSTAQISDDELAAMGLSDEGPQIGSDMMDATGFGFDGELGDEVATKLDLAKAYIEMDDAENAKSILSEVIEEGNATQAQLAKDILSTLS